MSPAVPGPALGSDPLRNGALLLCLLLFLGGGVLFGFRLRGLGKEARPLFPAVACRMTAVLGALSGFVVYLQDLPRSGSCLGLLVGGIAALPWIAVAALEAARQGVRRRPGPRR